MGIFDFLKSKPVYIPDCMTYFKFNEHFKLYKKIFSKLGINYKLLDKTLCSGFEALEVGYESEARNIAKKNFEILSKENINSIITTSPGAYKIFSQDYPRFIPSWNIKILNLWELILKKLKNSRINKISEIEVITFNDNCYLGRYSGIYDEPRKILKFLGYEIKELDNFRENSFCTGSCGSLPLINIFIANKIAKEKILQAKRIGVKKMVVIGFEDYEILKNNVKNNSQDNIHSIEILEISEVLGMALGFTPSTKEEKILLETKANIGLAKEIKGELD